MYSQRQSAKNVIKVFLCALFWITNADVFSTSTTRNLTCITYPDRFGLHRYEADNATFTMTVDFSMDRSIVSLQGDRQVIEAKYMKVFYEIETNDSTQLAHISISYRTIIQAVVLNYKQPPRKLVDRLLDEPPQICLPEWVLDDRLQHTPYSRAFWEMAGSRRAMVSQFHVALLAGSVPAPWLAELQLPGLERLRMLGGQWPIPHPLRGPMPQLRWLNLTKNGIVDLPDDFFSGTPAVSEVLLPDNPLARVPRALLHHAPLRQLEVGGVGLSILPEDAAALDQLERLVVHDATLRPDAATALFALPRLRHLELTGCRFRSFEPLARKSDGFEQLFLPGNDISSLPPDFHLVGPVQHLDLSYNFFAKCPFENLDKPVEILKVIMHDNLIETITRKCLSNLLKLQELDFTYNRIHFIEPRAFVDQRSLIRIRLGYNSLTSIDEDTFFIQSKKNPLQVIALENNNLQNVTILDNEESKFTDLEVLDISSNSIENLETPAAVGYMIMRDVNATEIAPALLDRAETGSFRYLDLGDNPLQCCRHNQSVVERVVALQDSPAKALRNNRTDAQLTCTLPDVGLLTFSEFEEHREACDAAQLARVIAWSVAWAVQGALAVLLAVLLYRRRADFVYARDLLRIRRLDPDSEDRYATCVYDAFVCFSSNSASWVTEEFVPTLENDKRKYKFCVHTHDFTLGLPIAENIMLALKRSRKVICILTPQFVESEWGAWELQLAALRMLGEARGYLLLVLREELDEERLPRPLRLVLATRTSVRWPPPGAPPKERKRCYRRLVAALGDSLWERTGKDPRRPGTVSDLT